MRIFVNADIVDSDFVDADLVAIADFATVNSAIVDFNFTSTSLQKVPNFVDRQLQLQPDIAAMLLSWKKNA